MCSRLFSWSLVFEWLPLLLPLFTFYCSNVVSGSYSVQVGSRVELLHAGEGFWRHQQHLAFADAGHRGGRVRQARRHGRSDPRPVIVFQGQPGQILQMCGCVKVAEGQEICVIEAMKMQNSLTAVKQAKVNMSVLTKALREFKVHFLRGLQHNSVLSNELK